MPQYKLRSDTKMEIATCDKRKDRKIPQNTMRLGNENSAKHDDWRQRSLKNIVFQGCATSTEVKIVRY